MYLKEDRVATHLKPVNVDSRLALMHFMWANRESIDALFSETQPGVSLTNLYFPEWQYLPRDEEDE